MTGLLPLPPTEGHPSPSAGATRHDVEAPPCIVCGGTHWHVHTKPDDAAWQAHQLAAMAPAVAAATATALAARRGDQVDGSADVAAGSSTAGRRCAWCGRSLEGRRGGTVTCSTPCRQARNRFVRAVGHAPRVPPGGTMRLAYADPPYPGKSERYYGDHPDFAGEVDHAELVRRMATYDGWALSTSAEALPAVLALCPPGVRVAAWVRGARVNRAAWRPVNAWEPVIYWGGRNRQAAEGEPQRTDVLEHHPSARTTDPARVVGAKPAAFARWVFDLLGALPGDQLDDLFPGSGGMARAWDVYTEETTR